MHIDYAREVVEYHENNFDDHDLSILKSLSTEAEVQAVADTCVDEKTRDIIKTMREIEKSRNRHRHVTEKQRYAVAQALLDQFGTARAVLARAFNTTEAEMFGEDEVVQTGSGGKIVLHKSLNAAFDKLADFAADSRAQAKGTTYRASQAAIRSLKRGEVDTLLVEASPGQVIAVTAKEAGRLGLPEYERGEWYSKTPSTPGSAAVARSFVKDVIDEET